MKALVLGGARSGKSRFAEQQVLNSGLSPVYLATAQALDGGMGQRISLHQQRRDQQDCHWATLEEPLALADTLVAHAAQDRCILVDCLTLWVTNCLLAEDDQCWAREKAALLSVLPQLPGQIIMVSNEVGQGVVPMDALSRRFVDESGWLHQELASLCDSVTMVVAGLPMHLKGNDRDL